MICCATGREEWTAGVVRFPARNLMIDDARQTLYLT